jgi:hypothetical protein
MALESEMIKVRLLVPFVMLASAIAGCGTLEVGIESSPTPAPTVRSTSTVTASATGTAVLTPTPLASPTPARTESTPQATATSEPDRITFPVGGNTFTFNARLTRGEAQRFILRILAQQTMSITTGSNVTVTVLDARNDPLQPSASSPGQWQGTLPQTGDYIIVLLGQGLVTVTIEIPPPGS